MATRTVVCPECDAPLGPGRFACAACGAVLATVASGSRSPLSVAEPAPLAAEPGHQTAAAAPALSSGAIWVPEAEPAAPAAPAAPIAAPSTPSGGGAPGPTSSAAETPSWPAGGGVAVAAQPQRATAAAETPRHPAGAYLPPSAVLPPAEALPLPSTKPAAPATAPSALAESMGSLSVPSDAGAAAISIGAAISAVGFLLPWADVVLGSRGMGTFLDRWGLAAPGHIVVFAALLLLAGMGTFSHRLPRRVRPGLPAVVMGSLLVGLAWPYLFGPFGASVGIYVVTAGGLLLTLAGGLDVVLRRHATVAASV